MLFLDIFVDANIIPFFYENLPVIVRTREKKFAVMRRTCNPLSFPLRRGANARHGNVHRGFQDGEKNAGRKSGAERGRRKR